jgi:hypothetical protein
MEGGEAERERQKLCYHQAHNNPTVPVHKQNIISSSMHKQKYLSHIQLFISLSNISPKQLTEAKGIRILL